MQESHPVRGVWVEIVLRDVPNSGTGRRTP